MVRQRKSHKIRLFYIQSYHLTSLTISIYLIGAKLFVNNLSIENTKKSYASIGGFLVRR